MGISHGAEVKNCGIAIGISNSLQLTRYGIQCLIPGYPGEFATTSVSSPLKWVEQTIGTVNTLTVGTAPQTHPMSRFAFITALNSDDPACPDMHFHFAGAAAVAHTYSADNLVCVSFVLAHHPSPTFLFQALIPR
jgi:hypothetical protein